MKKSLLLAATVLAVIATSSAQAQTASKAPFYAGIEGGIVSVKGTQTGPGETVTSENKTPLLGRLSAGYQITPNVSMELGYFFSGDYKQSVRNGANTSDYKASYKGADLTAVYKFTDGLPGLFLKAGATYAKVSGNLTTRTAGVVVTNKESGSATGLGYLLGIGYEMNLTEQLAGNVSYTRYQRVGGADNNDMDAFTVGLKYRF